MIFSVKQKIAVYCVSHRSHLRLGHMVSSGIKNPVACGGGTIPDLVACGGGTIPGIHRDGRDHSQKFLLNPSDERNHTWQFLLDRKLVAPGGGKNTGQAVYSAERRTPSPR